MSQIASFVRITIEHLDIATSSRSGQLFTESVKEKDTVCLCVCEMSNKDCNVLHLWIPLLQQRRAYVTRINFEALHSQLVLLMSWQPFCLSLFGLRYHRVWSKCDWNISFKIYHTQCHVINKDFPHDNAAFKGKRLDVCVCFASQQKDNFAEVAKSVKTASPVSGFVPNIPAKKPTTTASHWVKPMSKMRVWIIPVISMLVGKIS